MRVMTNARNPGRTTPEPARGQHRPRTHDRGPGEAEFWWGERFENHEVCRAGDFSIPAGVPHLPANLTAEPCECVVARTDAGDQESVVLRADLDLLIDR